MNIIEAAQKQQAADQAAIKRLRESISWVFSGQTFVDAKGRVWHEATANGTPVWSRFTGTDVVSEYDIFDIERNVPNEGREATIEEITAKLEDTHSLQGYTFSGIVYEIKRSDSAGTQHVHKFYNNGAVAYVRGFRSGWDFRVSLSIGMNLDFFA